MKKQLPMLTTDKGAEDFIDNANLAEYDLSVLTPIRFEFQPKEQSVTMHLSEPLLANIKAPIKQDAVCSGMPYQGLINQKNDLSRHLYVTPWYHWLAAEISISKSPINFLITY